MTFIGWNRDGDKSPALQIILVLAVVLLGSIYGYKRYESHAKGSSTAPAIAIPPQTVSAVAAQYQQLGVELSALGSVTAMNGVDISSQVAGTVAAIHFESGDKVKKGQLLLELVATEDVAKLEALKATADLSKLTYDRATLQLEFHAVSQHVVDTAKATWLRDQALASQQRALVELKSIRAPFSGELGFRRVDLGQYLEAGTPITTLEELDSVYLDFHVPQQAISRLRNGLSLSAKVDTYPNRVFEGTISAIDRSIDLASRNIKIRATLANTDHALLPGMFVTVEIATGDRQRHIAIPQSAINYHSYGNTVYIIDRQQDAAGRENLQAREVQVATGEARGDQIVILSGVEEGQTVVTMGQSKLTNGTPVVIDNSVANAAASNSTVADQ